MLGQVVSISSLNTLDIFKNALNELIQELRNCNSINEIIVFGSVAKGLAKENSDIDICVFSDEEEYDLLTNPIVNNTFLNLIKKGIDTSVDLLVYKDIEELETMAKEHYMSVEKSIYLDGITVYKSTICN